MHSRDTLHASALLHCDRQNTEYCAAKRPAVGERIYLHMRRPSHRHHLRPLRCFMDSERTYTYLWCPTLQANAYKASRLCMFPGAPLQKLQPACHTAWLSFACLCHWVLHWNHSELTRLTDDALVRIWLHAVVCRRIT